MAEPVFELADLRVSFPTDDGIVQAVRGVDLVVHEGELVGVVGESGSGKSVSSSAILGLHRGTSAKVSGRIVLEGSGQELLQSEAIRKAYLGGAY